METPNDRARELGITTPAAQTVQPVSVSSVPVSTTSKEIHMSANNTIAETVTALIAAGATAQQIADTVQALTAAQNAALAQTQPQPTPVLASQILIPEKKTFVLGRPDNPFIPEAIEVYAPCRKDKKTGKLTEEPNGNLCLFLGPHSKIPLGADEWRLILPRFEDGTVREMMEECERTGKKQQWKL